MHTIILMSNGNTGLDQDDTIYEKIVERNPNISFIRGWEPIQIVDVINRDYPTAVCGLASWNDPIWNSQPHSISLPGKLPPFCVITEEVLLYTKEKILILFLDDVLKNMQPALIKYKLKNLSNELGADLPSVQMSIAAEYVINKHTKRLDKIIDSITI